MREEQAQRLGIRTISDLGKHPEVKLGFSPEFLKRSDGWPGLKAAYRLSFPAPRGLEHGLAYEAIAGGQIDVMDIYTTDAKLDKYKLRVLEDDRSFFPRYDAVLLYRVDLPQRLPQTWAALQTLEGTITEQRMIQMNADAELRHQTFAAVATAFLQGRKTP
jgi:osmoprotectant transport system permease protein